MWQAITAAFGLADNANKGAQAQYGMQRAEYDASVGFTRAKDMSYYDAYAAQTRTILIIAVIGLLFIAGLVYLATKK